MNVAETLRGLVRRWYIVVPGLILAVALAFGAFVAVQPGYERTATQLLLPGQGTVPDTAMNPFLFLGSLTQAAEIIVRTMGSESVIGVVNDRYPGTDVEVSRDPLSSGPVVLYTVTARDDEAAAGALDILLNRSTETIERLQEEQAISPEDRITVTTLTLDTESTLQQRNRITISAGIGLATVVLTLIVAAAVDGLVRRVRQGGRRGRSSDAAIPLTDGDDLADEEVLDDEDAGPDAIADDTDDTADGAGSADTGTAIPDEDTAPDDTAPSVQADTETDEEPFSWLDRKPRGGGARSKVPTDLGE